MTRGEAGWTQPRSLPSVCHDAVKPFPCITSRLRPASLSRLSSRSDGDSSLGKRVQHHSFRAPERGSLCLFSQLPTASRCPTALLELEPRSAGSNPAQPHQEWRQLSLAADRAHGEVWRRQCWCLQTTLFQGWGPLAKPDWEGNSNPELGRQKGRSKARLGLSRSQGGWYYLCVGLSGSESGPDMLHSVLARLASLPLSQCPATVGSSSCVKVLL